MRANANIFLTLLIFGILISNMHQVESDNVDPFELNFSSVKYTGIEKGDVFVWKLVSGELWGVHGVKPNDTVTVETIQSSDSELLDSGISLHDRFNSTFNRANELDDNDFQGQLADDILFGLIYPNYGLLDNGTELNIIELFWFHDFNLNLIEKPWLDRSCIISEDSNLIYLNCSLENTAGVISEAEVFIHKETGIALQLNTNIYEPDNLSIKPSRYRLDLIETNNTLLQPVLLDFLTRPIDKDTEPEVTLNTKSIGIFLFAISGIGLAGFIGYYFVSSNSSTVITNDQTKAILKQMFNGKTSGFIALAGSIYKKDITYGSGTNIPTEMFDFKFLMHPVRLAIMKLLIENPLMTTTDLKSQLNLSWGEISNHIKSLKKQDMIYTENKIVDNSVKQVICVNPNGIQEFNKLSQMLIEFFNSPNYDAYLESVEAIISNNSEIDKTDLSA